MNKLILILLSVVICSQKMFAQKADNFDITFIKTDIGNNSLRIKCQYDIDFENKDSLVLNFGGNLSNYSIDKLHINSKNYILDCDNKTLTFIFNGQQCQHIIMSYEYCNLSCTMTMKKSTTSEIWDVVYDGASEYFIPHQRSRNINYHIRVKCKKQIGHILSCPYQGNIRVPFTIVFFDKASYDKEEFNSCIIYQINAQKASLSRTKELYRYYCLGKEYFERLYHDSYLNSELGIDDKAVFFFHDGNDLINRFNLRLITMSQLKLKDSSYSLFAVLHELGHRWMGEYTILAKQGARGNAFLTESIVEFTVLCCIKDVFGPDTYESVIKDKINIVESNKNTKNDVPVMDITSISNYPVIYNKGPLILDKIARKYGYDKVLNAIASFYDKYSYKENLEIYDFIVCLKKEVSEDASNELIRLLTSQ